MILYQDVLFYIQPIGEHNVDERFSHFVRRFTTNIAENSKVVHHKKIVSLVVKAHWQSITFVPGYFDIFIIFVK
jgi:hypothetical protein